MNVYFVSAGEVTTYDVIEPGVIEVPETGFLVELVAAPTRSAATYDVWRKHQRDIGGLTEQHWQTKLVAKDADRERGILRHDDPLWERAEPKDVGPLRP